jgi:hypothetical protein
MKTDSLSLPQFQNHREAVNPIAVNQFLLFSFYFLRHISKMLFHAPEVAQAVGEDEQDTNAAKAKNLPWHWRMSGKEVLNPSDGAYHRIQCIQLVCISADFFQYKRCRKGNGSHIHEDGRHKGQCKFDIAVLHRKRGNPKPRPTEVTF